MASGHKRCVFIQLYCQWTHVSYVQNFNFNFKFGQQTSKQHSAAHILNRKQHKRFINTSVYNNVCFLRTLIFRCFLYFSQQKNERERKNARAFCAVCSSTERRLRVEFYFDFIYMAVDIWYTYVNPVRLQS